MIGTVELAKEIGVSDTYIRRTGRALGLMPQRIGWSLAWTDNDAASIRAELATRRRRRPRSGGGRTEQEHERGKG